MRWSAPRETAGWRCSPFRCPPRRLMLDGGEMHYLRGRSLGRATVMEMRIYRTCIRGGFMKMRLTPPVAAQGAWLIAGRSAAGAVLLALTVSACTGGGSSVPSIFTPTAPTGGHSSSTGAGTRTPSPTGQASRSSGSSSASATSTARGGVSSSGAPHSSSSSSAPASSSAHASSSAPLRLRERSGCSPAVMPARL